MASLDPITVICPECGIPIEIPVSATPGDWVGLRTVEVNVGIDREPITAHVDQHQTEPTA
jgi:hypothetical protein